MKKVITISREFGSGGRTIGKLVAEKLGYAFYDGELIEKVASQTGLSPDYIKARGEYAPSGSSLSYSMMGRPDNGMATDDKMFAAQRKIILELAEEGNCVIVGRCADYILKDRADALHVFIHADKAFRADRIVRVYGSTSKKPEKRVEEKDKRRRVNYKYSTDRNWGDAHNYHISLDSGLLGIDNCVDLICVAAKAYE